MMTAGAKLRISVLAVIAVTIAAVVESREDAGVSVSEPAERIAATASAAATIAASAVTPPEKKREESAAVTSDPFAPRGWQKLAAPVEVVPVAAPPPVVVAPAPEPAPAPAAPTLPYAFMGQFDDGGRQVVYLSRNDQTFVATQGETIEGSYKVLAMDSRQIEFEHTPTGTRQVLSIPAPNN